MGGKNGKIERELSISFTWGSGDNRFSDSGVNWGRIKIKT
jgi:hypothetical protein